MSFLWTKLLTIAAVSALLAVNAAAQTAGSSTLAGTVRDSSGAAVPDAAIELTDVARGLQRTTQANGEGAFLFPAITPGAYQLRVSKQGFEAQEFRNITSRSDSERASISSSSPDRFQQ